MHYQKVPTGFVLRILRDEEVIGAVKRFCSEKGIGAGSLSGVGAVKNSRFGHYDLREKKFVFTEYPQLLELLSMDGNVGMVDGAPTVHVHAVFSDDENRTLGGHVDSMVAAITAEIHLVAHGTDIERKPDDFSGLKLLTPQETV